MADRKLIVQIVGDDDSLRRAFRRSSAGAATFNRDIGRATRGALAGSGAFHSLGRSITFASTQFLGGAGIVFAFKQIIAESSRLQEETEKTGVVFGRNAAQVQAWSKTLAESFGVSEGAALQAAGTFGNMLRPLGFGTKAAAAMSERLVQLAADMASFNNKKPDEVLQALQSGLAGQVRPLRALGVFLSQARIQTEAYADGIAKSGAKLTQAQKVQAAYNIILKDTKDAQGDVARNTGSLSVAWSKLTAGLEDLEGGLGEALLPQVTRYVNVSAAWLNQTKNQERIQRAFNDGLRKAGVVMHDVGRIARFISDRLHDLNRVTGDTEHSIGLLAVAWLLLKRNSSLRWALIQSGLVGTGGAATVAAGEVAGLRAALLGLGSINPIVIPITLLLGTKQGRDISKQQTSNLKNLLSDPLPTDRKKLGDLAHDLGKVIFGGKPTPGSLAGRLFGIDKPKPPGSSRLLPFPLSPFKLPAPTGGGTAPVGPGGRPLSLAGQFNLAELRLARASLTAISSDDRAILVTEEAIVKQQIEHTKKLKDRTELTQKLASILDSIRGIDKASADAEKQAAEDRKQRLKDAAEKALKIRNARQFGALGLGPTGAPLVPNAASLRKDLGKFSDAVSGTFLDTTKTQSVLSKIRRVLKGGLGKLSQDVRATIKGMLDDLNQQLSDNSFPVTKGQKLNTAKFISALGLDISPADVRKLRAGLSRIGPGGTVPPGSRFATAGAAGNGLVIVNHMHNYIDGKEIAPTITKHQQKAARRNPGQRRGPHAGR